MAIDREPMFRVESAHVVNAMEDLRDEGVDVNIRDATWSKFPPAGGVDWFVLRCAAEVASRKVVFVVG